jgi:hypothetical protein
MTTEHAVLHCEACDRDTEHDLHYAGRLLESTRCTRCGRVIELSPRSLLPAYAHDLEQRIVSKPRRMLRRARRDPVGYALLLPRAVLRQPAKFVREFWSLVRRS